MHVLLTAATPFELAPVISFLESTFLKMADQHFRKNDLVIQVLVTGVGAPATAWHLGKALTTGSADWVINAGVAGAFDSNLQPGTVVQVISERFADLGVEEADGRFTDVFELGLTNLNHPPFVNGVLYNSTAGETPFLPLVRGLTVNRVHGTESSIAAIRNKYPEAQIETMEGAAVFYGCLLAAVPFVEIRSISNYVEPRNRAGWELELAIEQLNIVLVEMLQAITPPGP
ncbi:MAG: futalosine hydrolase [Saprospiraceae bacterium]|nr:futalosine hydrolase [Lewinellaceae bacterium]